MKFSGRSHNKSSYNTKLQIAYWYQYHAVIGIRTPRFWCGTDPKADTATASIKCRALWQPALRVRLASSLRRNAFTWQDMIRERIFWMERTLEHACLTVCCLHDMQKKDESFGVQLDTHAAMFRSAWQCSQHGSALSTAHLLATLHTTSAACKTKSITTFCAEREFPQIIRPRNCPIWVRNRCENEGATYQISHKRPAMNFANTESANAESSASHSNPNEIALHRGLNAQVLSQNLNQLEQQAGGNSWRSYYEDPNCEERWFAFAIFMMQEQQLTS